MACVAWMGRYEMLLEIFAYPTVAVVHFTGQNWISKTMYCIRCVMVRKIFSSPNSWRGRRKPASSTSLAFFLFFIMKFVFSSFWFLLFDEVSNFHNRISTNQKHELGPGRFPGIAGNAANHGNNRKFDQTLNQTKGYIHNLRLEKI